MTGADRENLLKAHEAAASFAHRAANDAKRTREILEGELSTLRAQLAEAECALGGFCKPPFDGSLVTGIKAISMRCAGAESERDSLKRQLEKAIVLLRACRLDIWDLVRAAQVNLTGLDLTTPEDAPIKERIGHCVIHQDGIDRSLALREQVREFLAALSAPAAEQAPCPCCGKPASLKEYEVCNECKKAFEGVGKPAPAASLLPDPKCPACEGTGWYGDNGPGIKGNREYHRCDQCGQGKPSGRG